MKRVVGVGLVGGALVAAVLARSARGRVDVIGSADQFGRNLTLAKVGARTGARWARHQAQRTFADAERQRELDDRFELQTAEDITAALGNLKGAMMKVGQMVSYLDVGMPENLRVTLAQLQQDAPPMSATLAIGVVEEELGAPIDQLFSEFDPTPLASASIGQVHRAITADGHAVAVKVQYPGVGDAVAADLANSDALFGGLKFMFPGLDSGPIVEELRARLTEELDYGHEASNQRFFASYFDGHPKIHVPKVIDELSSTRVLTTDLAVGARFDEVLSWSQAERDLTAETLYRFSFGSIYTLHAFNGDPHPGNYLFRPGGEVTFLDFGLVKTFSEEETELFGQLIQTMVIDEDVDAFRDVIIGAGLLQDDGRFSNDEIGAYFRYFYEFVMGDQPMTLDDDYAAAGVRQIFDATSDDAELKKVLNVPPAFVVIQRINLGLMSLFGKLHATADWRAIAEELWPFVAAPPSTPMGEEIAAFRAARGEPGGV